MKKIDITEYFLDSENPNKKDFISEIRTNISVEPLIDGINTFKRMANEISNAQSHVYMSAWIFNPRLKLVKGVKVGGKIVYSWIDLFVQLVKSGVEIKIIISDFDPILKNSLHSTAWKAYDTFFSKSKALRDDERERLQVICSRHEAVIELFSNSILEPRLIDLIKRMNSQSVHKAINNLKRFPGLWELVNVNPKKKKNPITIKEDARLIIYPASHHQKVCTIDGKIAFVGGLDIQKGRYDNQSHNGQLWHDINCAVDGEIVGDIELNFMFRWNSEIIHFDQFLETANSNSQYKIPRPKLNSIKQPQKRAAIKTIDLQNSSRGAYAQVHRTLSENSIFGRVPSNVRDDIFRSYIKVISKATKFIYIENQYLRSHKLVQAIVERFEAFKIIQVIVVIPVAPEEAKESPIDPITNLGLYLQHRSLSTLKSALGQNIGIYSMINNRKYTGKNPAITSFGSLQIYVHSKCLIVDDIYCSIGSANTNPRSFEVDTELSIGWCDRLGIKKFRIELWNELLGRNSKVASWNEASFVNKWDTVANANVNAPISKRKGFVVPHDIDRFQGDSSMAIPDEFASYFDYQLDTRGYSTKKEA